jgi:uncharacterized damage-inducible protein DinB
MKQPSAIEAGAAGAAAAATLRGYLGSLARYHVWATARLYEHIDRLSDADYRKDAGLFFKSVHRTCNHLLIAEHAVWYPRFAEGVSNTVALDAELESDRAALRERLLAAVPRWQALIASFGDARFAEASTLDYTTTQGVAQSLPFAPTLGHVFNHASHHRGQITAAITAMGYPCPVLDWVAMLQAESRGPKT